MALRHLSGERDRIFLTFDDGLDEIGTPKVLDVLRTHGAHATFFLIASKIAGHEKLLERLLDEGHAIGNHSLDHRYGCYFRSQARLRRWVDEAEAEFDRYGVRARLVGFRPPAGVITPKLRRVLREKGEPLVMWSERFHDAVLPWTLARSERSAAKLSAGALVLLHDRQSERRIGPFCKTLDAYIARLGERGLKCEALTREICLRGGLL